MLSAQERLALLLNLLGNDAMASAVSGMDAPAANKVKSLVKTFEDEPPTTEEIDHVIDDFQRFFALIAETTEQIEADTAAGENGGISGVEGYDPVRPNDPPPKQRPAFGIFTPTSDSREDLLRLDPYQIAKAIEEEHPRTIAIVVNEVQDDQAGAIIDLLPEEIQGDVFSELRKDIQAPSSIVNQILKATVEKGLKIEFVAQEREHPEKLAAILRSMPKKTRASVLEKIKSEDEDFVQEIKAMLYKWEDLKGLNGQSVQKLLTEVETNTLITALFEAEEEILNLIFSNVSKRARQTMEEEMQFQKNLKEEEVELARKQVVEVMMKLDESGEIDV